MNRWTTLALGALLPLTAFAQTAAQTAPTFEAHVLTREEFDALQARPKELLIIDVRRPDEITSIGGFGVYLSIQPAELDAHLDLILVTGEAVHGGVGAERRPGGDEAVHHVGGRGRGRRPLIAAVGERGIRKRDGRLASFAVHDLGHGDRAACRSGLKTDRKIGISWAPPRSLR